MTLSDGTIEPRPDVVKEIHQEYLGEDGDDGNDSADLDDFDVDGEGKGQINPQAAKADIDLKTAREKDDKLDDLLTDLEPDYELDKDDDSASGYDFATVSKLAFWGFSKGQVKEILRTYRYRSKLKRQDYLQRTINGAWHNDRYDPQQAAEQEDADDEDKWHYVTQLYDKEENGSTTKANNFAAELLTEQENWAYVKESERFYHYNPEKGYYEPQAEVDVGEILRDKIPAYMNRNRKNNIVDALKDMNVVRDFSPPEGKVNVGNGVLTLEDAPQEGWDAFERWDPEYYFTSRIDTNYNPEADSELWDSFLTETCHTQEQRKKLMEFIGYTLEMWHHDREKNLFIVGPRQTGKSTFADTVQELFGEAPTVTNLTPQQVADTQFDSYALKRSVLNNVNDINATKIKDSGALKRTLSGERMKMEPKYGQPHFEAPAAKHMYTANWLPKVSGQDEALYRRVLISEFPNKINDDAKDPTLKGRLKEPEVLEAILIEALEARQRLNENGGFTADRDDTETRRKWDSWQDAHKRFLYTQCEFDQGSQVRKDVYFQAYKEFAERQGYNVIAKQGVTKSLQWVPEVSVGEDAYHNIKIKGEDAADDEGRSEREYQDLTNIDPRKKVVAAIRVRQNGNDPVSEQAVIDALATDMGEQKVQHTIGKLMENGTLIEDPPGQLIINT